MKLPFRNHLFNVTIHLEVNYKVFGTCIIVNFSLNRPDTSILWLSETAKPHRPISDDPNL